MCTLSLPLGTTTIPAHHYIDMSTFRMTPNCSIWQNFCSTCDFSGSRILWDVKRAFGIAFCFNTMLYSPSIVASSRPWNILGKLVGLHLICLKIYLLFLPELLPIISIAPPIIPFLFYCVNDNITMQE